MKARHHEKGEEAEQCQREGGRTGLDRLSFTLLYTWSRSCLRTPWGISPLRSRTIFMIIRIASSAWLGVAECSGRVTMSRKTGPHMSKAALMAGAAPPSVTGGVWRVCMPREWCAPHEM